MSSVPKTKRGQPSVEYVYNAQLLFHQTFEFALRLPKRRLPTSTSAEGH